MHHSLSTVNCSTGQWACIPSWHKSSRRCWMAPRLAFTKWLIASAHFLTSGAHPGVCCDVLAPWNSTASDPLPPAVHDSALTQQPSNYCTDFHLRRGPGRPQRTPAQGCPDTSARKQTQTSAPRSWSLLSALGSRGTQDRKSRRWLQQQSSLFSRCTFLFTLLLCVVFKTLFYFYPFDSTRITCQQFVPKYSAGVRG